MRSPVSWIDCRNGLFRVCRNGLLSHGFPTNLLQGVIERMKCRTTNVLLTIGSRIYLWNQLIPKFYEYELALPELSGLPDGEHVLTFQGRYDYPGNEEAYDDSMFLPFSVDTQKPVVTGAALNEDKTRLTISATDNKYLSAIAIGYTDMSGKETWDVAALDPMADGTPEGAASANFDVTGIDPDTIKIEVYDYALNLEEGSFPDYNENIRVILTNFQQLAGMTLLELDLTNRSDSLVNGVLIAAFYDKDYRLVQLQTTDVAIQPGIRPVTMKFFEDTTGAATIRLLLWDALGGMKPRFSGKAFNLE